MRVALRKGSPSAAKAKAAGLEVMEPAEAAAWCDVAMMLAPDEHHAAIWREALAPNLPKGAAVAFAHGFSVHFHLVEPRADLDVFMVAPKGPGHTVRSEYLRAAAACRPSSPSSKTPAARPATSLSPTPPPSAGRGPGSSRRPSAKSARPTSSANRPCFAAGFSASSRPVFETLVEAGYAPEMAYFECLHETKLIVDLLYEGGIENVVYSISNTAEYGTYKAAPVLADKQMKRRMRGLLADIQSGRFASEWVQECAAGQPHFKTERRRAASSPIEEVGRKLRAMMPWLAEHRLVDKSKN